MKAKLLFHLARFSQKPTDTARVFRVNDTMREGLPRHEAQAIGERMLRNPAFRRLYDAGVETYLARPYDIAALAACPAGSLGERYAAFMRANALDPEFFESIQVKDPLTFFAMRMRKTHDVWHVVTGFGTDVAGELGLQAFYIAQLETPVPLAILLGGLLHVLLRRDPKLILETFDAIQAGFRMGRTARKIYGVAWEDCWTQDLASLRASLGVRTADQLPPVAA